MFSISNFAQELYDLIKKTVPNLPNFWFDLVERDEEALLFRLVQNNNFKKYFNDSFIRISFLIQLNLKANKKHEQLLLIQKIAYELAKINETKSAKIVYKIVNDDYVNGKNLPFLTFNEVEFNTNDQNYFFNIQFLLTEKK